MKVPSLTITTSNSLGRWCHSMIDVILKILRANDKAKVHMKCRSRKISFAFVQWSTVSFGDFSIIAEGTGEYGWAPWHRWHAVHCFLSLPHLLCGRMSESLVPKFELAKWFLILVLLLMCRLCHDIQRELVSCAVTHVDHASINCDVGRDVVDGFGNGVSTSFGWD